MNKSELAEAISARANVTKKEAEDMVQAFMDIATSQLAKDGEVVLAGFGTFSSRVRAGRIGVNPQNTSEKITIHPTKVAKFKAGKNLKEALKKSQGGPSEPEPAPEPAPEPTPAPEPPAPTV